MRLLLLIGFVIASAISVNGQFTLDSLVLNKTLRTVFKYNEKGLPIYIDEHGAFENFIEYDSEDRIQKVVTKKFDSDEIFSAQEVIFNTEGEYDSLNWFNSDNFMQTTNIYKYDDIGRLLEVRSHHFYDDTINTEEHILYNYKDGLVTNFIVKYGEVLVGKDYYFYSEDKQLEKVISSFSGTFELSYNAGNELSSFVFNDENNYKIYRNKDISSDMFRSPKIYYDHIYKSDGYGLGPLFLRDVFAGDQPISIISDDGKVLVKYYYSTTVDNSETKIHGEWLSFFPNPTHDVLRFDKDIVLRSLSIYNMQGQLVEEMKGNLKDISIRHLPDAVYLINAIEKDGKNYVSKIVKSK